MQRDCIIKNQAAIKAIHSYLAAAETIELRLIGTEGAVHFAIAAIDDNCDPLKIKSCSKTCPSKKDPSKVLVYLDIETLGIRENV